jgi:hypothetical protein
LAGHKIAVVGGEKKHRADEIGGVLVALEGAPFFSSHVLRAVYEN